MRLIECQVCGTEYEHKMFDDNPICPECSEPVHPTKGTSAEETLGM